MYVAALYESTAITSLSCTIVFLMVLSVVYLLYEKKSVQVTLDMLPSLVDQREPLYVRIRARHRYRGCYGRIKVLVAVRKKGHKRWRCHWLSENNGTPAQGRADRLGARQLSGLLTLTNAGSYEIRLRKVRIYDMTGLFCLNYSTAVRGERAMLVVLPVIYPMGIKFSEAVRNFAGDAEVYDSVRSGTDQSETLKLRPFQDGDKLRNIHWKLSAKADELIVREDSMPRGCPVVVLVENTADISEVRLQCVASLSFCLMDQNCPHYMAWYSDESRDVVRMRVDDEESFYEVMLQLLREEGRGKTMDIRERYREKYCGEPLLHYIQVEEGPCIRVDEREAVNLKASALKQELSELELLL